jgi:DNA-binding transcriptional MerR regulator
MEHGLLIGDVASRSGVSRKALRLYEARGILPHPHRTASGYRLYPADVLALLDFVAQARRLGLTLGEIAKVARQRRAGTMPCSDVRALLERKAAELSDLLASVRRILRAWPRHVECYSAVCPQIEAKGGETTWRVTRSLCPSCTACPEIVIEGDQIRIGEDANTVILKKGEWNVLVDLIQSGQVGRL